MNIRIDETSCALPPADQQTIARTLENLQRAFARRDASLLNAVYSEDADWTNAFGSQKRGRAQIVEYLSDLFADGNFNAGKLEGEPQITLRALGPDVVMATGRVCIRGQGLLDGGVIELRDNFSIHVLRRQSDGRWPIVSEMYMDANRHQTFGGHSQDLGDCALGLVRD